MSPVFVTFAVLRSWEDSEVVSVLVQRIEVLVVDIFTVTFVDQALLHELSPSGITGRPDLLLLRGGLVLTLRDDVLTGCLLAFWGH
jgi:hypothetical protein